MTGAYGFTDFYVTNSQSVGDPARIAAQVVCECGVVEDSKSVRKKKEGENRMTAGCSGSDI